MKKQYINTLIALVILAGLWAGFTYYDKRKAQSAPVSTETKPSEKLIPVDCKHIQSFSVKPKDGAPITCRLESGKWQIESPQKLPADDSTVSSLLSTLTTATVNDVVDAHPANLKDYGLDQPSETLEVSTDTKPAQFALRLGDETPTGSGVYAQLEGNPRIVTLASYDKTSLTKSLFDLRDKRAVTLDADQIQKIEVKSKDKSYTLEKNPEGVWDLALPPAVRADRYVVDGLVSQLRSASMTTVVAEDKKKSAQYGFGSPALTVKLASPAGSQDLVLGKKDGEKYDAMNSALEPVFTLNSDFLTQFQKDPSDLRAKDLLSVQTWDVTRLDVQTPKGHWTFQKQKDEWKETAPAAKDLATDKMDSLLDAIHDLRADSFPKEHAADLSKFGLTKPDYHFGLQAGDKKESVDAAKVGDHVYARLTTDPLPAELNKTALDPIDKALTGL